MTTEHTDMSPEELIHKYLVDHPPYNSSAEDEWHFNTAANGRPYTTPDHLHVCMDHFARWMRKNIDLQTGESKAMAILMQAYELTKSSRARVYTIDHTGGKSHNHRHIQYYAIPRKDLHILQDQPGH